MNNEVIYEWAAEHWDEYGDIVDCYEIGAPQLSNANADHPGCQIKICLRRLSGNDEDGMQDSGYAYIVGDKLQPEFDCGHIVPRRFIEQVAKYQNAY